MAILLLLFSLNTWAFEKMAFMYETASGEKSLWVQGPDSLEKIDVGFPFAIYPFLSKDATELAFVAGSDSTNLNIFVRNLVSGKQEQITTSASFVLHPHLSANSRFLTYSALKDGKNHILIYDRQNKTFRTIEDQASLYFPRLSTNASFIVYQKTLSNSKKEVWLSYLESKEKPYQISEGFEKCMAPSLNFDDSLLVMTCYKEQEWNLFLVDLSTKKIEQITKTSHETFAPTFDRNNNIIFASNETGHFALYKMQRAANTYASPVLLKTMAGDLYAPSLSGDLSYQRDIPTLIPSPARSSFGAVHLNNRIYIFGGHQGQEHTYPPESFLDRLDIYDIPTKTWIEGKSRPVTAHGYGVEICNDKIYAFGGFTYSENHKPKWKSLARIDRYDPLTDEWTQVANLREPRSSNVVARVGEKIYLIGGWDSTPKFENDYDGKFHRSVEVFDCKTETLATETFEIPDPLRRAFSGFVKDGKILLIGGIGVGASHFDLLNNVTEFDPATGQFQELEPLPFATFAPATGLLGDELHVFGGMFKTGQYSYEYVNHVYVLKSGKWQHSGRYLTESKGFSMVLEIAGQLWVLGGHSYDGEADAPVPTVEVWEKSVSP